jgi:hypothetical protein
MSRSCAEYYSFVCCILFAICYSLHVRTTDGSKVKLIPQQAEVAQGVPVRLRPWIFLTFSTRREVGRHPYSPAAFTPGEIPGTHFSEAELTPGHMVLSGAMKNPQ